MTVYVLNSSSRDEPGVIDTTSHSDCWSRAFSPFFAGPVELWGEHVSLTVENAWQFTRLYTCHVDENGDPTDKWWKWAKAGWANPKAVRFPMGKGAKPLCHYWDGEKLDYIEARARIYCPLYAAAVERTEAWKQLKKLYAEQGEIKLWSFDCYGHRTLGMSYYDVLCCKSRKMGHGFVLAGLLEGDRFWESYRYIRNRSLWD